MKILQITLIFFIFTPSLIVGQSESPCQYLYVWDFEDPNYNSKLNTSLAEAFESALVKRTDCIILERRNYPKLEAHRIESGIEELHKEHKAERVAFGKIFPASLSRQNEGRVLVQVSIKNLKTSQIERSEEILSTYENLSSSQGRILMEQLAAKVSGVFQNPTVVPPPPGNELNLFKSSALIEIKKYEANPTNPPDLEGDLKDLYQKIFANTVYHRELPFEVGAFIRMYASMYFTNYTATNKDWDNAFRHIEPLLFFSLELLENHAGKPSANNERYYHLIKSNLPNYRAAIEHLRDLFYNTFDSDKITCEVFKTVVQNNLTIAMPTTDITQIESLTEKIAAALCQNDCRSHLNQSVLKINNFSYFNFEQLISAKEEVLQSRNPGNIHVRGFNPYYTQQDNGNCKYMYDYKDNGKVWSFHWEYAPKTRGLTPLTPHAELLNIYWQKGFLDIFSLETLLMEASKDILLESAIDKYNAGKFGQSAALLIKLTQEHPDFADGHWHLGRALYGELISVPDSNYQSLKLGLIKCQQMPMPDEINCVRNLFLENPTAARIIYGEYPFWIKDELEIYLELDPAGDFAKRATEIISSIEKINDK